MNYPDFNETEISAWVEDSIGRLFAQILLIQEATMNGVLSIVK